MEVVFVSNFINHHQIPISEEFCAKCESYHFIATTPINEERLKLGYHDLNSECSYVVCAYENSDSLNEAKSLILDADVVIWGSAPFELVKPRIENNKLTFRYSERLFKNGILPLIKSSNRKIYYDLYGKYSDKKYFLLCASAFSAKDYRLIGSFNGKKLKWGYFPPFDTCPYEELISQKKRNEIVWCGRFIDWKHPESIIYLAEYLLKRNNDFHITMIGTGEKFLEIKSYIESHNLENCISLLGAVDSNKVREYMRKAAIFVFTSDKEEGWGAVLNEGMNSACVPVVCAQIGSAPFLVTDGKNGFTFDSCCWKKMSKYVERLLADDELYFELSKEAHKTIVNEWNPKVAVENFLLICEAILKEEKMPCVSGPCEMINN